MQMQPKINFVLPGRSIDEIAQLRQLDLHRDWMRFNFAAEACTVQNHLILNKRGIEVALTNELSSEAINIGFVVDLRRNEFPENCFVVGVRADYTPYRKCHFHIVLNKHQLNENTFWIPPWAQPGLIPRDPERGTKIERVGYFGRRANYYRRFMGPARRLFNAQFGTSGFANVEEDIGGIVDKLGLELVVPDMDRWNDNSDVDIVLAFRSWGNRPYPTKPPQKMVRAWMAGCPFIAGGDSAYMQIGTPGTDYLRTTSPEEFEHALKRLVEDPELYNALVRNGREKASEYNEWLIAQWRMLVEDVLPKRYEQWRRSKNRAFHC